MGLQWAGGPLTLHIDECRGALCARCRTRTTDGEWRRGGYLTASTACPGLASPGQADTDSDGVGDACNDADDADGDGWAAARRDGFCPAVAKHRPGGRRDFGQRLSATPATPVRSAACAARSSECDDGNFFGFDCRSFRGIPTSAGQPCGAAGACLVGGGVCDDVTVPSASSTWCPARHVMCREPTRTVRPWHERLRRTALSPACPARCLPHLRSAVPPVGRPVRLELSPAAVSLARLPTGCEEHPDLPRRARTV